MPACAGGGGERDAAGEDTVAKKTKENSGQINRFLLPPYEVEQGRKNCSKILCHSPAIVQSFFFVSTNSASLRFSLLLPSVA